MRPSIHGGFLSRAHLGGLLIVYSAVALLAGVAAFIALFLYTKPTAALIFLSGLASGAATVAIYKALYRRITRARAMDYIHRLHELA